MKFAARIAIASTVALTLSAGTAFAFGHNHHFGGSAKYLAGNVSGATGHVNGSAQYGSKGYINSTNSSEQYNSTYRSERPGFTKIGGESGAINQISTNWKNVKSLNIQSNSGAFGASGITNKRY
ncbi:MAG: hypothetical protein ACRBBN_20265 [Methyloligellaceae bacterium]